MAALKQRLITVEFQMVQPTAQQAALGVPSRSFPGGTDTLRVSGLRVSARINKAGTPAGATLNMQIYGMTLSTMNQLATLGMVQTTIKRNTVTILAGDAEDGLHMAFYGTIQQAWTDFGDMPNVAFHVEAQTLGADAVIVATPTSIEGPVDVAAQMQKFATQMGLDFENNGVTTKIPPSYFYGSLATQAAQCAKAARNVGWFVDNKTLAIWPLNGNRGGDVPTISKDSGLVRYPSFTAYGLMLTVLFNPAIKFQGKIKVDSSLSELLQTINTSGEWAVYYIDHDLESIVPKGRWFTTLTCYNPNFPPQIGQR